MREIKSGKTAEKNAGDINNAEIGNKKGVRGVFKSLKRKGAIKSDYNKRVLYNIKRAIEL